MQYGEFKGLKLSLLGFGAMRLPVIDGNDANVDVDQTMRMVEYAMEHGINYYDTALGISRRTFRRDHGRRPAQIPKRQLLFR